MPRVKYPASSFGPRLHSYLTEGANREVRIKCDTDKLATRLMQRLNSLRKALKDENHADWKEYYRCGIHRDHADRSIVILRPRDSEFDSMMPELKPSAPPLPPEAKIEPTPDTVDPADAFLASLRGDVLKK